MSLASNARALGLALILPTVTLTSWAQPAQTVPAGAGDMAPRVEIDLGESSSPSAPRVVTPQSAAPAPEPVEAQPPVVNGRRSVGKTADARPSTPKPEAAPAAAPDGTRHVEFARKPISVSLQSGRERLVTFPGPVVLHVPQGSEGMLRLQTIGRTVFATALAPFGSLRVVAEDLERDARLFPIDFVARQDTVVASDELEIHAPTAPATAGAPAVPRPQPTDAIDMVVLTRYASQTLYAPTRLVPASTSIRQVPVKQAPAAGLYRGSKLITAPIASWRAGGLFVTAVKVTNTSAAPLELDLDQVRGEWLAATAQHNRLGARGTEADTTAIYLVCDKPFEACR
jgi:integrating conjugative element protein (TIGR03749 family)